MAVDEKKVADLETRLEEQGKTLANLNTTVANIGTTVAEAIAAALVPLSTSVEALTNAEKGRENDAKAVLVNKVVEAGILTKEAAESLTPVALTELANKVKPGKAAQLNAAVPNNQSVEDEFKDYDLNAIVNESAPKKDAA